jgi:hypothetical protein
VKWRTIAGELNVYGVIPPYHRQKEPTHHSLSSASTGRAG